MDDTIALSNNSIHEGLLESSRAVLDSTNELITTAKEQYQFIFTPLNEHKGTVTIVVPESIVTTFVNLVLHDQQKLIRPTGIDHTMISPAFIKEHYESIVLAHAKEFLLKFNVIDVLHTQLHAHHIHIGGSPRLTACTIAYNKAAEYHFELTLIAPIAIGEWKLFPFKTPNRKQYKDLDRQVESLIKEEDDRRKEEVTDGIALNDWVFFSLTVLNEDMLPLEGPFTNYFWCKIGDEEVESPLKELFLHKKIGDSCITRNQDLQTFLSHCLISNYAFKITILDLVPHQWVCFDYLKQFFKIKTQKDLHKKLIEVFSFRNDLSQRRTMVEEALKVLLQKHTISLPKHLVLQRQDELLSSIKSNPDYNVYRRRNDFEKQVENLARKQSYELVLITQIAKHEQLKVSVSDVKGYLNLLKRQRLRGFLYFDIPQTEVDGRHLPLSMEQLKLYCLREKTINYVIYHLTKK